MSTVLVIDSNDSILLLLQMMLARARYQMLSASDGAQGLEIARSKQPGVILVDELLPVIPGIEVCQRLKNDLSTRHIPVILSTASLIQDPAAYARRAGADAVLRKPFRAEDVLALLRQFLPG